MYHEFKRGSVLGANIRGFFVLLRWAPRFACVEFMLDTQSHCPTILWRRYAGTCARLGEKPWTYGVFYIAALTLGTWCFSLNWQRGVLVHTPHQGENEQNAGPLWQEQHWEWRTPLDRPSCAA